MGDKGAPMSARAQALRSVKVGDLVFGLGPGGQKMLLLVYDADDTSFLARNVTTQLAFKFGRDGNAPGLVNRETCLIISTAKLPPDMHDVAVGLDRKCGSKIEYPGTVLSQAEIQLLLTDSEFFMARPLPED